MGKTSKGDIVRFIKDAADDPDLHEKMMAVVNKKGKRITPEKLLKEFQELGYYGVSLQDCSTVLFIIRKGMKDPSRIDFSY